MKLSEYAKKLGISYTTAWRMWKKGSLDAYQLPTGTIIVNDDTSSAAKINETVCIYARVSSSENKDNLKRQSQRLKDYALAKGYKIYKVVEEIGSGLNDNRKKLLAVLSDDKFTVLLVEHKDRLTSNSEKNNGAIASIDLGLNNLMALTSNQAGFQPILVNGRPLKSINQFYNKKKASLQQQLPRLTKNSQRILRLTRCRNQKINNYLHHASSHIVKILSDNSIEILVIGRNKQQKQFCNIGKTNNQNFVNISHSKLIAQLTYKCELEGIKVILAEESYTSASSFLDNDPITVYGDERAKLIKFSGQRIKRGLYRSSTGKSINSDVNASYNILRKVFPKAFADGIGSCVVQPRLVTPTKEKMKGKAEMPFTAM